MVDMTNILRFVRVNSQKKKASDETRYHIGGIFLTVKTQLFSRTTFLHLHPHMVCVYVCARKKEEQQNSKSLGCRCTFASAGGAKTTLEMTRTEWSFVADTAEVDALVDASGALVEVSEAVQLFFMPVLLAGIEVESAVTEVRSMPELTLLVAITILMHVGQACTHRHENSWYLNCETVT